MDRLEGNWQRVVDDTIERFGKVDIFVTNARIHEAEDNPEVDVDGWNRIVAICQLTISECAPREHLERAPGYEA